MDYDEIRPYLAHTTDQHGFPCPDAIRFEEHWEGLICICGLLQPKRYVGNPEEDIPALFPEEGERQAQFAIDFWRLHGKAQSPTR